MKSMIWRGIDPLAGLDSEGRGLRLLESWRRVFAASAWLAFGGMAVFGLAPGAFAQGEVVGRAVLPAKTFAEGPIAGRQIEPANGFEPPFENQPVQGFSAVQIAGDGTLWAMSDNGFGSLENSADYHLRIYRLQADFKTAANGSGEVQVLNFIELKDPEGHIPFAITNEFTDRVLTGADFDIESFQIAPDGTIWIGDEFGPFLLHFSASGELLEPPFPLPDFDNPGKELRSPQNPFNEEASAVRVMNAVREHARARGNDIAPVFSPWHAMLMDDEVAAEPDTSLVETRENPTQGSGLKPAASEIFDPKSIQSAGYPIITWTVNTTDRMRELIELGVNGIISDRPDLLLQVVKSYDSDDPDTEPDFMDPATGLIDPSKFDAQGHRGGRNLRPENTLPAMEVALDNLMTTLETDMGVSSDRVPMLAHDPTVEIGSKCRDPSGRFIEPVPIKTLSAAQIQAQFICDGLIRGEPQANDPSLSPVSVAFAAEQGLADPYVMPTLQNLLDFIEFYLGYYGPRGAGADHPMAQLRRANAMRVRVNAETKINPRKEFADRTVGPEDFVDAVLEVLGANPSFDGRVDIQSFDFRTLLEVHEKDPTIRTVFLFGDFPIFDDPTIAGSDDGTNLQDEGGANTPWLAGLFWPYRETVLDHPFRVSRSGGFEGMALARRGRKLFPLLEKPLEGDPDRTLLIHEFDLLQKRYTGRRHLYVMEPGGSAIGDFVMFNPVMGLVIERDGSQGDLGGLKHIYRIQLRKPGGEVRKGLVADLLNLANPNNLSLPTDKPDDVGVGDPLAFPFVTIEDVAVVDPKTILVMNDNNFPFSVGRHLGNPGDPDDDMPDDNEFVLIKLDKRLPGVIQPHFGNRGAALSMPLEEYPR